MRQIEFGFGLSRKVQEDIAVARLDHERAWASMGFAPQAPEWKSMRRALMLPPRCRDLYYAMVNEMFVVDSDLGSMPSGTCIPSPLWERKDRDASDFFRTSCLMVFPSGWEDSIWEGGLKWLVENAGINWRMLGPYVWFLEIHGRTTAGSGLHVTHYVPPFLQLRDQFVGRIGFLEVPTQKLFEIPLHAVASHCKRPQHVVDCSTCTETATSCWRYCIHQALFNNPDSPFDARTWRMGVSGGTLELTQSVPVDRMAEIPNAKEGKIYSPAVVDTPYAHNLEAAVFDGTGLRKVKKDVHGFRRNFKVALRNSAFQFVIPGHLSGGLPGTEGFPHVDQFKGRRGRWRNPDEVDMSTTLEEVDETKRKLSEQSKKAGETRRALSQCKTCLLYSDRGPPSDEDGCEIPHNTWMKRRAVECEGPLRTSEEDWCKEMVLRYYEKHPDTLNPAKIAYIATNSGERVWVRNSIWMLGTLTRDLTSVWWELNPLGKNTKRVSFDDTLALLSRVSDSLALSWDAALRRYRGHDEPVKNSSWERLLRNGVQDEDAMCAVWGGYSLLASYLELCIAGHWKRESIQSSRAQHRDIWAITLMTFHDECSWARKLLIKGEPSMAYFETTVTDSDLAYAYVVTKLLEMRSPFRGRIAQGFKV